MAKTGMLFNTDLEALFTNNSIDEIEKLSQGLKHDIDQKREELRTMVGERYRDLMEAADTITQMKASSESVIGTMKSVIRSSNDLQSMSFTRSAEYRSGHRARSNNRGLGDNDDDAETESTCDENIEDVIDDRMVALAAQIKLLTDSPEKMWSAVEQSDFLLAAQLYLFARHVHTSLMLNDPEGQMSEAFPVIDRQWGAVAHFREAILEGCQKALASTHTDPDKAVEAMASMVFLLGISSTSLLNEFMTLRETSLKEYLVQQDSQSAKTYIGQTLMSIVSFLQTVHRAFVVQKDGCGHLERILERVSSTPTLSLFHSSGFSSFSSPVMKHLPQIIRDFCPSVVSVDSTASTVQGKSTIRQRIEIDHVKNECTQWLDRMHDHISERTGVILEHVNTIAGLSMIRKTIYQRMKDELVSGDWEKLCLETLLRKISLWDEFYRNLFLDRVESLIETRMTGTINLVLDHLGDPALSGEGDTFNFIWSEVGLNDNNNNLLSMKTKAFSPHVQNVCQKLNTSLQKLMEELFEYVDNNSTKDKNVSTVDPLAFLNDRGEGGDNRESEPFSLTVDNQTILKFAQKTCIDSINKMVVEVSKRSEVNLIELGRLYQAMTELCPAIQKCVEAPILTEDGDKTGMMRGVSYLRGTPEWNQVKKVLEDESNRYFLLWIGQLVSGLKLDLSNHLTDNLGLVSLAEWDVSEISEEAEDGTQVRSVIRVPQYISVGLHTALAAFVRYAHVSGPHALPQSVQLSLTQDCAASVVEAYFRYSEQRKLMQNVALQLHFDIQFVLQCMVSRDNRSLSTSCSSTLASLEKHIDPFDMSVFSPYMSEHVKRCLMRSQTIFGVLIPSDRFSLFASMKASLGTGATSGTGSGEQQHNVIRMSSVNVRFPLLPVSSIATTGQQRRGRPRDAPVDPPTGATRPGASLSVAQPSSRSSSTSSSRKRSKSPAAKSSASFFGSMSTMSTSWFGGK